MSVLLRQSHGLKGFRLFVGKESLEPCNKAVVVEGEDGEAGEVQRHSAPGSSAGEMVAHKDLVAVGREIKRLESLVLEGIWFHPLAQRGRASNRRLASEPDKLDVGIDSPHNRLKVAAIERLVDGPQHLHVLLRHRRAVSRTKKPAPDFHWRALRAV